ncbi:MAG: DUF1549 domain-containing protein [Verrucomicrobiota bacterium]
MPRFPLLFLLPCLAAVLPAAAVDFSHEVVPILKTHCAECHMGDKKKGGFSMNTREDLMEGSENGKVLIEGKGAESLLIQLITSADPDEQMPPKGARLTAAEVQTLTAWVDAGVPWTAGFAFKKGAYEPPLKPRRPVLPAATAGRENPVDRILDAHLAKQSRPVPAPLSDNAFFRRVHLDLVGLLPSPEQLTAFLADSSPGKRQQAIALLLNTPQPYAEHWLTFWNDLLRNDYAGTGYIDGGRQQISAWLYQALLENKPYDQFVRELVAPVEGSAGFGKGIKWRGQVSAGQLVPVQFAQSMGQTFLGINLKCASCHDSFIDRWKLDEAYGLAAVFSAEPLEIHRCDKPTGRQARAAWLFPELGEIDASQPPAERLKQLAALMTHPENGRFTRTIVNRLWHRLMGHGIVHPVDAMQSEPWSSDLLDFLATDLADHQYDLKRTLALICSSKAYQSVSEVLKEDADRNYTYAGPRSKRLTAEQFTDAIWQITGTAPRKFDAPVKRAGAAPGPEQALTAKWIWSGDQKTKAAASGETVSFRTRFHLAALPQTASAVLTCDNAFTLWLNQKEIARSDQWEKPVAVDLLDALRTGENEIVIVGTNGGQGPNLAGLWMQGQLRFADGSLNSLNSDPSWLWNSAVPNPNGLFTPDPGDWKPAVEVNGAAWQRINDSLQGLLMENANGGGPMVRASLMKSDFLMRALGRPNREQIVSMRPNDLTTLEAMDLNNGQILTTRLEAGARAILQKQAGAGSAALVSWLYAFAYSRTPSPAELALATEALGSPPTSAGLQDLLWALLVQPEFQMVR